MHVNVNDSNDLNILKVFAMIKLFLGLFDFGLTLVKR